MELNTTRIRELLDARDSIDQELAGLFTGTKERKPQQCSICKSEMHSARKCPDKPAV